MQGKSSSSVIVRYPPEKKKVLEWAGKLATKLTAEYSVHLVSLFGSYCDGKYSYGSDADLAIVHDDSTPLTFEKALTIALEASDDIDWEIHLYSLSKFKEGMRKDNRFLKMILEKGIVLFNSQEFKLVYSEK